MRASLILLATTFAASVIAAPMPIEYPDESPAPLKVREVNGDAALVEVENLKREILERLDAIVQRSTPDADGFDANEQRGLTLGATSNEGLSVPKEKRRLVSGSIPPGLNYKRNRDWDDNSAENYKRDRDWNGNSAENYKRDRDWSGNSAENYKRDRDWSGNSAENYKRDRDWSGNSAENYKRNQD